MKQQMIDIVLPKLIKRKSMFLLMQSKIKLMKELDTEIHNLTIALDKLDSEITVGTPNK